jgi:phosphatidylserine decarboxylase
MASICARQLTRAPAARTLFPPSSARHARLSVPSRNFSSSRAAYDKQNFHRKESFRSRLNSALKNTKIKWEPIPIALGIGFLGAFQFYRIQRREKHSKADREESPEATYDHTERPKKRERIRPSGPWCVRAATLAYKTC